MPGASETSTIGINNAGQAAGTYLDASGIYHGYVASLGSIITPDHKDTASVLASSFDKVSNDFDAAAIVVDGRKELAKNIATATAVKVMAKLIAGNDRLFGQTIELSYGECAFLALAAKGLTKGNVLSIALEADSLIFSLASVISNAIAADPPDPNYTTVEPPQALSFPPTGNSTVDHVIADYLTYTSTRAAVLHAAERWQGAQLANDQASVELQLKAFDAYKEQASADYNNLNDDNALLISALHSVDINRFPGGTAAIVAAFNAQCEGLFALT